MEKMLFIGGPMHGQEHEVRNPSLGVEFAQPRLRMSLMEEMDRTSTDDYFQGYGRYSVRKMGMREGGVIYQREVMVRDGMEDTRAMIELRELLINQWLKREALT
jgi:hypothetical protein